MQAEMRVVVRAKTTAGAWLLFVKVNNERQEGLRSEISTVSSGCSSWADPEGLSMCTELQMVVGLSKLPELRGVWAAIAC